MNLTPKQQAVYLYIRDFIRSRGFAPSFDEIRRHFGLQSFQSVQKYLAQLERKGYIRIPGKNMKRAIEVVEHGRRSFAIPLAGWVAAGKPIDAIGQDETLDVPEELMGSGEYFALKVRGNSMIEEGIFDGDTIVVRKQATAENGQTVVALLNGGEATVKKYYRRRDGVELRPANAAMESIHIREGDVIIQGVVVGLLRRY
jgi:repressor LexA